MNKVLFSHNSDDWQTPKFLMDELKSRDFIDTFEYKCSYDQFTKMYKNKKIYINPPFSRLKDIPKYIYDLLCNYNKVLLLMPARTDTKYFEILMCFHPFIYFITGRLHFNDSKKPAPFPCILLYFNDTIRGGCNWYGGTLEDFPRYFDRVMSQHDKY